MQSSLLIAASERTAVKTALRWSRAPTELDSAFFASTSATMVPGSIEAKFQLYCIKGDLNCQNNASIFIKDFIHELRNNNISNNF